MTVSFDTNEARFQGNGATTVFSLPFRFFSNADVDVYLIDNATSVATPQTEGVNYTLTGAGEPEVDGNAQGILNMLVPPALGKTLLAQRAMAVTQPTDFVNQGRFFAEVHENAMDRLAMLIQDAYGFSRGAIRVAITDPEPNRLPNAAARANKLLSFDVNGQPVATLPAAGSATQLQSDLAAPTGSSLVGFLQAGTNAVPTTALEKLRERVSILDFMTDAERNDSLLLVPTLNTTAAWMNALNFCNGNGDGTKAKRVLVVPSGRRFLVDSLTVFSGVSVLFDHPNVMDMYRAEQSNVASTLRLTAGASINLQIGSGWYGGTVIPAGMTFPQTAAQVATWAGTAFTAIHPGATIANCVIAGFNLGIDNPNSRGRFYNLMLDCQNGIRCSNSFDITYLDKVHCWPYASIGTGNTADFKRSGKGIRMHDVADWAKLTDCFTFGYNKGFSFENAGAVTALSCGADNVIGHAGAFGFEFLGTTTGEIRLAYPQASAHAIGIYINSTHSAPTANAIYIDHPNIWTNAANSIQVSSATGVHVRGGKLRNSPNAFVINNSNAFGSVDEVYFTNDITNDCIQHAPSGGNWDIGEQNVLEAGGTGRLETATKTASIVAIAATLLPNRFRGITLFSGTAVVTAIDTTFACIDKVITCRFISAGSTITHSGTLTLKSGANVVTVANQIMRFQYFGNGVWCEI